MSKETRHYDRCKEAEELIKLLCDKYPDLFWTVRPEQIAVMAIDNQERGEKAIKKNPNYAKLRPVKGAEKAIFESNNIPIRQIIELYYSDYNTWNAAYKQAVLASIILGVSAEEEKTVKKDLVGYKVLTEALGVNWDREPDNIPNMLKDDVPFNLDLRPGLAEAEENSEDEPEDAKY